MRLRVRCNEQYDLGGLQRCMIHVPDHLLTVGDLLAHISRMLDLNLRGGGGELPLLSQGGFAVPAFQELRGCLRDDEVVDIDPRLAVGGLLAQRPPQPLFALPAPVSASPVNKGEPEVPCVAASKSSKRPNASSAKAERTKDAIADDTVSTPPPSKKQRKSSEAVAQQPASTGRCPPSAKPAPRETDDESDSSPDQAAPVAKTRGAAAESVAMKKAKNAAAAADARAVAASAVAAAMGRPQASLPALPAPPGSSARGEAAEPSPAARAHAAAMATCGAAAEAAEEEVTSIYVGGLPPAADNAALESYFSSYGAVDSVNVVMDRRTGEPKGFGFVTFATAKACDAALKGGTEQWILEKKVWVKPRDNKAGKGDRMGKDGKGKGKGKDGKGKQGKGKQGKGDAAHKGWQNGIEEDAGVSAPSKPAAPAEKKPRTETKSAGAAGKGKDSVSNEAAAEAPDDMQAQMAALGLPVSFVASGGLPAESDEEEEEEEGDSDSE